MGVYYNTANAADYLKLKGVDISSADRRLILNAIKDMVDAGLWDKIHRLYMPIWGNAVPNAICWKSFTSGKFVNTVIQGDGFVDGDRIGYFNTGFIPSENGLTSDIYLCALRYTLAGGNQDLIGGYSNATTARYVLRTGDGPASVFGAGPHYTNDRVYVNSPTPDRTGILSYSAKLSEGIFFADRESGGRSILGTDTYTTQTGSPPTVPLYCMASNQNGSAGLLDGASHGFWIIGDGLTDSEDETLTLIMKNLWEGLTGLSIPS